MSDQYTAKGTIKHIGETQQVTEKFKNRLVVLTLPDEKFPQDVPFEFSQNNVSKLDTFNVGDEATVTFNLRGREFKDKFYSSLSGWKIESSSPF